MQGKVNFNKSIRDKERKILEYYKKISNNKTAAVNVLPKPRKRTKKQIPKKEKETESPDTKKLTKTAKLPISEPTKPKVVDMD
jgi:hypothetical protein